jgi:hypothetical protein
MEYRTMEKVQKNSVSSVQHTPSSESFQVYLISLYTECAVVHECVSEGKLIYLCV